MRVMSSDATCEIRRLDPEDVESVLEAASLFDHQPQRQWSANFLARTGNHLLIAYLDDVAAGFVSGVEIGHPDKPMEMLIYELGVDEPYRRRGIGRALVQTLGELARTRDCKAMWVPIEPDNEAAVATYRSAGADAPESAAIMSWSLDP